MPNPTVVFVCTGNTCRSPMAAALAASIFQQNGIAVEILSAGVAADPGSPASKNAVKAMGDEGLDLHPHRSAQISREILQDANLVITMTAGHLYSVNDICPQAKAFTLGDYAGESCDVSDPYGGNLEIYRQCAAQIKQLITQSIAKFKEDLWKA